MISNRLQQLRLSIVAALFVTFAASSALSAATPRFQIAVAHGSGTTTITNFAENPDGTLSIEAAQEGTLYPYGAFDGMFAYIATIDEEQGTTRLEGDGTFVFANGDELYLTASIIQFGVDYPKWFIGILTVTGGTGSFAGAQGFLEIDGVDGEEFTDPIHLSGIIAKLRPQN